MMVVRPDLVTGPGQVIPVMLYNIISDLIPGLSVYGHKDGGCRGFRPLDAFRMVVGDLRCQPGHMEGLLKILLIEPRHRRNTHGRFVSVAVIGFWILLIEPYAEIHAETGQGICLSVLLHGPDQRLFDLFI